MAGQHLRRSRVKCCNPHLESFSMLELLNLQIEVEYRLLNWRGRIIVLIDILWKLYPHRMLVADLTISEHCLTGIFWMEFSSIFSNERSQEVRNTTATTKIAMQLLMVNDE